MKERIIIWGGNAKQLSLDTLDSHASVNAYFLTKHLKEYFEIINITDIDAPEEILNYDNIHAVLATSQCGFTNRLIKKGKLDLYNKIKKHINGKLCSIIDNNINEKYYEDILFCVRPVNKNYSKKSKSISVSKNLTIIRSGWNAEPEIFYPENIPDNEINIFIDHAPYSSHVLNYVEKYYSILNKIVKKFPEKQINVYHQNDLGIVKWNFKN